MTKMEITCQEYSGTGDVETGVQTQRRYSCVHHRLNAVY